MIVDSSYLFDLMADEPDAFEKGTELVERGEMQWLPTPVVAETYYGVATARSDTTEQEVRNRLLGYPRVDVDEAVARRGWGTARGGRRPRGWRRRRGPERRVHRSDGGHPRRRSSHRQRRRLRSARRPGRVLLTGGPSAP